jgi:predicted DNA-binding WGR domain protein
MPRLIAGGSGHRKLWHGYVDGASLTVRFGGLGKRATTQVKKFPTAEKAESELAKLVKQKLAKGYEIDGWKESVRGGRLELVRIDDLPPMPERMEADTEEVVGEAGHLSNWSGDYALGFQQAGPRYITGLADRTSGRIVWRPFKPVISPGLEEWDTNMERSFAWAFDSKGTRFIAETNGAVVVIDCERGKRTKVTEGGDPLLAVALCGEFAALLRKGKTRKLELHHHAKGAWSLAKTLPCAKQDALESFASGEGLLITHRELPEGGSARADFLCFRGADVRSLGSVPFGLPGAVFEKDGKSYITLDRWGQLEVVEIQHIAEAFDEAFKKGKEPKALRS